MNRFVRLEDLLVRQGVLAIVLFAAVGAAVSSDEVKRCRMLRHRKGLTAWAISPPA